MMYTHLLAAMFVVSTAAQTTLQLFIDNMDPNAHWAASVIEACNGTTTYAAVCTSAEFNSACSSGAEPITVTEGPSIYIATTEAIYSETSATITETCTLDSARTSASCVQTIAESNYGQGVARTTSFNLTGSDYHQYDVEATAGSAKLDDDGVCSTSGAVGISGMLGLGGAAFGTFVVALAL